MPQLFSLTFQIHGLAPVTSYHLLKWTISQLSPHYRFLQYKSISADFPSSLLDFLNWGITYSRKHPYLPKKSLLYAPIVYRDWLYCAFTALNSNDPFTNLSSHEVIISFNPYDPAQCLAKSQHTINRYCKDKWKNILKFYLMVSNLIPTFHQDNGCQK